MKFLPPMIAVTLGLCPLLYGLPGYAKKAKGHAHEHGAARGSLAFEGLKGLFILEGAAENFFGFEHETKTEKDTQTVRRVVELISKEPHKILEFPSQNACTFVVSKFVPFQRDGKHAETLLEYAITCATPPSSAKILFDKRFHGLSRIELEINSEKTQKKLTLTPKNNAIAL